MKVCKATQMGMQASSRSTMASFLELAFQTSPERGVQNEIHLPQWLRDVCEDVTNKPTKPEGSSRALARHLVLPLHPHCQDMTVVDSFKGKSFSVNSLNQTQQMKFSMHTTAAGKRIWQSIQSRLATRKSHLFRFYLVSALSCGPSCQQSSQLCKVAHAFL